MDVLYIIIQLFIWGVVLAIGVIPGIILGSIFEVAMGRFAFWPGFLIGLAAFAIYIGGYLYGDEAPATPPQRNSFAHLRRMRLAKRLLKK